MARRGAWVLATLAILAVDGRARADVVVSSNDGHTVLDSRKSLVAAEPVRPDTVSVIDAG